MKRLFNSKNHGVVDYLAVIILAVAPATLKFGGLGSTTAYSFAGVFLALSLCTAYSFGVVKRLSFAIHGMIDFYLSWILILFALFALRGNERIALVAVGACSFVAFLATDFTEPIETRRATTRKAA